MQLTQYQIDAFADRLFTGNPAAVIKLGAFLSDELMQLIAMENNLSETAFVVPRDKAHHYDLRWFTPTDEIEFCGHATIATAHALLSEMGEVPPFHVHTQVGELIITVTDGLYQMDAPIARARIVDVTPAMADAFPVAIETAFEAGNYLYIVLENADELISLSPDMARIRALSDVGVCVTARDEGVNDCVSRGFFPTQGIDEDPVTGSAHAAIGPYWAERLGVSSLTAYQASSRGGVLKIDVAETRVTISGRAVTFMTGVINLPD